MTDGIYDNITIKDYHANRTHDSSTTLKWAKRSLGYYDFMRKNQGKEEVKSHFDFGNAFELALTNRVQFNAEVAVAEDAMWVAEADAAKIKEDGKPYAKPRSSSIYQAKQKEFEAASVGKYTINDEGPESYETIETMLESCMKDKIIQALIANTEYQLSLFWHDDQTGLGLKTRPDICKRKKNVIVNIKTILDGSPDAFSRELAKYDYPFQACVEITGALCSGLMPTVDNYFWLVCEKVAPFHATVYEFDPSDIRYHMDELEYVLAKLKEAKEKNFFPGYSDRADNPHGILTAKIPMWARTI